MGVNLRSLMTKTTVSLEDLGGKSIAIDAYNTLYQFLAIIRQPDGTLLKDRTGRVTSHLSGLLYRTSQLVERQIKVIYVFDGTPPALKEVEIKRRMRAKEVALVKYEKALKKGDLEEARIYAQATSKLKDYMADDSKKLLTLMGIPWVQAPSEGEAQAVYLAKKGDSNFCASQDYDALLFGTPRLLRNVTITGRRKLPRKKVYIQVLPELIELDRVLKELDITHEQLIDIGILLGTDFNPDGVKGVGPKTALKLIKKHGNLEKVVPQLKEVEFPVNPQKIRDIFLNPEITTNYKIEWREPDIQGVVDFLCGQRDFSVSRVQKTINKMTESLRENKSKVTLESWFS
ncbi:flap endonuclease-1 [Candidatus Bathyarchaeota archaeon]|nr:flap endonuclease-1 [Candidatus Bathyarchaeota archaeon]